MNASSEENQELLGREAFPNPVAYVVFLLSGGMRYPREQDGHTWPCLCHLRTETPTSDFTDFSKRDVRRKIFEEIRSILSEEEFGFFVDLLKEYRGESTRKELGALVAQNEKGRVLRVECIDASIVLYAFLSVLLRRSGHLGRFSQLEEWVK